MSCYGVRSFFLSFILDDRSVFVLLHETENKFLKGPQENKCALNQTGLKAARFVDS